MKKAFLIGLIPAIIVLYFTMLPQKKNEALIGGEFTLIDQNARNFSSKQLRGKYFLLYFGFTNCPNICPTDIAIISAAMDTLKSDKVVPVFITIDPKRDTPERLQQFFTGFNKNFIALTGSPEVLKDVQFNYKIYSQEVKVSDRAGYVFEHSSYTYLMGKKGEFITHFPHNSDPAELVRGIEAIINK
jgi:cytochrome oxidase Cu insertion factor (SCO1/SenC/PrrC family)